MMRAALLALLILLVASPASAREDGPLVFVSVPPQQTFVARIGGDRVRVRAMVQPDQSPHTYEPTPRQVAELAQADLYLSVGVSFEDVWMPRIRAANPRLRVLDLREGLPLLALADHHHDERDHGHDHGHHGDAPDPHVWTSPPIVKAMSVRIRDALTELDPDGRETYTANQAALAADLDALDAELQALLKDLTSRRFMVHHPAWGYFAHTYDLTQVAIEREGKEPGARALTALIEQAKREGVRLILVQPQMNPKSAEQVARAIGGEVAVVDPLAPDYAETLRRLARLISGTGG
jgi:zinc transport system substrate-binding protein